ncbi:MAG TPA: TetR/AcrR family transcriptional regulator [Myxococcota bacterium]|nr:TetR/AcrR family transcriptional regulator [Myxococcota bacterium]
MRALPQRAPKAAARAEAQRARILDAAQKCFIGEGFHAASMAHIAQTAGMSPGLIYRYFESKNAVVLAIIARELEGRRDRIAALRETADIAAGLVETFRQWRSREGCALSAALLLEMSAEATREPGIAAALRASDRLARGDFEAWLARPRAGGGQGLAPEAAEQRALLLQCLFEGLAVRAAREPDLDPATLQRALEPLVAQLLSA